MSRKELSLDGWLPLRAEAGSVHRVAGISDQSSLLGVWAFLGAIVVSLPILVVASMAPGPHVNVSMGRVRVGGREYDFSEIDSSSLEVIPTWTSRNVLLRIWIGRKLLFVVSLREGDRIPLTGAERDLIRQVVAGSAISMPSSQFDPFGKFARYNFPANLTKDETLALLAAPPAPKDALPIPQ